MKKHLLSTTALAAAGVLAMSGYALAADKPMKPTLSIKGAFEQNVGFADNDIDGRDGFENTHDNEITFAVKSVLDNGITVRGQVELEGNTSADQIDEAFLAVGGSFGEFRMGSNDEAAYEMTFGYHGSVGTGAGNYTLEFDVGDWVPATNGLGAASTRVNVSSDARLIAYYSPRVSGLQFGASYSRTGSEDKAGGYLPNTNDETSDIGSVAVNYAGKWGDVGVGVALGYVTGSAADTVIAPVDGEAAKDGKVFSSSTGVAFVTYLDSAGNVRVVVQGDDRGAVNGTTDTYLKEFTPSDVATNGIDGATVYYQAVTSASDTASGDVSSATHIMTADGMVPTASKAGTPGKIEPGDDPEAWGGGIRVDVGGIRVGVGYVAYEKGDTERDRIDVGARYSMGPHSFRVGYISVEEDSGPQTTAGIVTYARALGPGVTWSVDALWADYENADGSSKDGNALTTGIKVAF